MATPVPEQVVEVTAPRRKRNRNRSDPDDTSTSDAASKKAEAEAQRRNELILSYARHPNGQEMELPLDGDFTGFHALSRQSYYVGIRQLREQINSADKQVLSESLRAPSPWVPDPTDDSIPAHSYGGEDEKIEEDDRNSDGSHSAYNNGRPRKRMCRKSNLFVLPEDESDEKESSDLILRKTPHNFMGIPREIRMKIYRHLLVNKKPITVHGGWKQVHRSNKLNLSTSILSTCKIVHDEACVVLYGENVFAYLLRDPVYSQQAILNLATDDDEILSEDESDSGSEYEDEEEESLFCNDRAERCIDIAKFAHLFRKIVVEAERNRYSKATQQSMATAIRFFAKQSDGASRDDTCNIRTLTIRVSPLWHEEGDEPGGRFTFIDFFEANAPVIKAIKTLDCQILHVEILTRYMSRQSSSSAITLSEDGSVRLTVDRRCERYLNMIHQGRAHQGALDERDKVTQLRMGVMANRASVAIDELAKHVEEQCKERNFHQDTTMGLAINWPNIYVDKLDMMTH
ncbi:hypothetical protein GGI43DRAFT_391485 [Trichoderma evansii]